MEKKTQAIGGIFLVLLIILCGVIALAFLAAGIALAVLSWLPFASPEFLYAIRISFLGEQITDPSYAFFLFLITGLTLAAVGLILFGFEYYVTKTTLMIFKDFLSGNKED